MRNEHRSPILSDWMAGRIDRTLFGVGHGRRIMIRPYILDNFDATAATKLPLPMRLLRRILIGGKHTIGQHVLIAGDHCSEIAQWLDELGFDVEAIDDSVERLTARQKSGARFEIHFASLEESDFATNEPF